MIESCGSCRFWSGARVKREYWMESEELSTTAETGYCLKYAPSPIRDAMGSKRPAWPETTATSWCGEWQYARPRLEVEDE